MFLACHTSLEGKANCLRANFLCKFLGVDRSCIPFMFRGVAVALPRGYVLST
jgi:hypothetical protein